MHGGRLASRLLVVLLAVVATGCAPGLLITRRAPPEVDPGATVRRLAILPEGDPAVLPLVVRELEQALPAGGTYTVIALCGEQPCGPFDAWVRANAAPVTVAPPEPGKSSKETHVTAKVSFALIRGDGAIVNQRTHTVEKSGEVKEKVTIASLTESAVHELVENYARLLVPRSVQESIELDDAGPLKAPVKRATDGDLDGAAKDLEALLVASPNLAGAHYDLGVIAEVKGDFAQAEQRYGRAVALEPKKDLYVNALGAMKARQADSAALQGR